MEAHEPGEYGQKRQVRARKWLLRLVVLLLVAGLAYGFRASLLRASAQVLIVDDGPNECTHFFVMGGDRWVDVAAKWAAQGAGRQILLSNAKLSRGEIASHQTIPQVRSQRLLVKHGVPPEKIVALPTPVDDEWETATVLREWMAEHQNAIVAVSCTRFETRKLLAVLSAQLGEVRHRIRMVALPDRDYDENNWWQVKDGQVAALRSAMSLGYILLNPHAPEPAPEWDPDAYERDLK
jgi:hypothetical protein